MSQMASGQNLLTLKESLMELTLRQSPIHIFVLATEVVEKFILGVDILHTYDAFVDLGCHAVAGSGISIAIEPKTPVYRPFHRYKNLDGQMAYCIQHLQEYSFSSEYHQGLKHNSVGALS
jgi:hypothetical protein